MVHISRPWPGYGPYSRQESRLTLHSTSKFDCLLTFVLTFGPPWPRNWQRGYIQIYESFWMWDWRRLMLWMVGCTCGGKRKRRWAPSLEIPTDTPTISIRKLELECRGCGWKLFLLIGFFWALQGTETQRDTFDCYFIDYCISLGVLIV